MIVEVVSRPKPVTAMQRQREKEEKRRKKLERAKEKKKKKGAACTASILQQLRYAHLHTSCSLYVYCASCLKCVAGTVVTVMLANSDFLCMCTRKLRYVTCT